MLSVNTRVDTVDAFYTHASLNTQESRLSLGRKDFTLAYLVFSLTLELLITSSPPMACLLSRPVIRPLSYSFG